MGNRRTIAMIAVCLGIVWIVLATHGGTEPEPTAVVDGASPDAPLVLDPGPRTARPRPGDVRPAPSPEAPPATVVRVETDRAPPQGGGAFVSVRDADSATWHTVRAPMQEAATDLIVPDAWFADGASLRIVAGIAGPRQVKQTMPLDVVRGEPGVARFDLDVGERIAGRAVDVDGQAVAGIRIVARTTRSAVMLKNSRYFEVDDVLRSAEPFVTASATTAADGSFTIEGLSPRSYFLRTASMEHLAQHPGPQPVPAPATGVEVVVVSAHRFALELVDSLTGAPVPYARARCSVATEGVRTVHMSCVCRGGHGDVAWYAGSQGGPALPAFDLRVDCQAFGYEPTSFSVPFPAGERVVSMRRPLAPLSMGRLTVHARDPAGRPVRGPLRLKMQGGPGAHTRTLEATDASGVYTTPIPAGSWRLQAFPLRAFGIESLSGRAEVQVVGEEHTSVDVVIPSFGSVRFQRDESRGYLLKLEVHGRAIITAIGDLNDRLPAVPSGAWPYELSDAAGRKLREGTLEVRPGVETVFVLEP